MMAGYLISLTWVFLLALCCTPTPAHSENVGRFRSSKTPAPQPQYAPVFGGGGGFAAGGVGATRPN
ncbi:hypothetical protein Hamer_G025801, partial [Homarus americanus]